MRRRALPFACDESGSLSVETVVVLPALLFTLMAIYVFWDGYSTSTRSLTATHTVADLVSRERGVLDQPYLDGMRRMFDALTTGGAPVEEGGDGPTALRVSLVENPADAMEPDEDVRTLLWSHAAGSLPEVVDIAEIAALLPALADGDHIVVVETVAPWSPLIDVGLASQRFESVAVTRPRFGNRLCWESCSPS